MTTQSAFSSELYDTIVSFGLRSGASILDVGNAGGADVFERRGFAVTLVRYEKSGAPLPYPDERFDAVVSAQNIHVFDERSAAIAQMVRVLKRGGTLAIWWKQLMAHDGVREMRDDAYRDAGLPPPAEGLVGGFKEFYAAEELRDQVVRVLPFRTAVDVETFVNAESAAVREALKRRLNERTAGAAVLLDLPYVQYLYLAHRR